MPGRTSSCSEQVAALLSESGQASVEAAFILPTLMLVLALLLQPVCLLYTRAIMRHAAAGAARAALTDRSSGAGESVEFALRRLAAVPDVPLFHIGGRDGWRVEIAGAGTGRVSVSIEGRAKPLPLLGATMTAFGAADGEGAILRVELSEELRPGWVEGGYGEWISFWAA